MTTTFQVEEYDVCKDEIDACLVDHWHEIAINHADIPLDKDEAGYQRMAEAGELSIVTVRKDGRLVGYHATIVRPHLHYKSTLHGFVDVYYVKPECRNGRVGVQLFMEAEKALRARGVVKVFSGTKTHKHMGKIFERLGWHETETLYSKLLNKEIPCSPLNTWN